MLPRQLGSIVGRTARLTTSQPGFQHGRVIASQIGFFNQFSTSSSGSGDKGEAQRQQRRGNSKQFRNKNQKNRGGRGFSDSPSKPAGVAPSEFLHDAIPDMISKSDNWMQFTSETLMNSKGNNKDTLSLSELDAKLEQARLERKAEQDLLEAEALRFVTTKDKAASNAYLESLSEKELAKIKQEHVSEFNKFLSTLSPALKELVRQDPSLALPTEEMDYLFTLRAKGTRKRSVAHVKLAKGSGNITINQKRAADHFTLDQIKSFMEPLLVSSQHKFFDVDVAVTGGGPTGQTGAIRLAIARALVSYRPVYRVLFRPYRFLTRDSREVERKKPGQKKARKKFAWVKR